MFEAINLKFAMACYICCKC